MVTRQVVWNVEKGQVLRTTLSGCQAVMLSADARMAVAAGGTLKVWDAATGVDLPAPPAGSPPAEVHRRKQDRALRGALPALDERHGRVVPPLDPGPRARSAGSWRSQEASRAAADMKEDYRGLCSSGRRLGTWGMGLRVSL
jgi:hypothetical protein